MQHRERRRRRGSRPASRRRRRCRPDGGGRGAWSARRAGAPRGSCASARARRTRWRSPPESWSSGAVLDARRPRAAPSPPRAIARSRARGKAERRQVRRASHEHHLERRERELERRVLRHDREPARERRAREVASSGRPSRRHAPARGAHHAGEEPDERRLAAAVRADDADELARRDREAHVRAATGARAVVEGEALRRDGRRHASARPRLRRRSQMKNGPPRSAVTTPTGSSAGASAVRATRVGRRPGTSPPPRNDAGTRSRWSGPRSQAEQMRHDEADEADHAAHRDRRADQQRRRDEDGPPRRARPRRRAASALSSPTREQVQVLRVADEPGEPRRARRRRGHRDQPVALRRERAHDPEEDALRLRVAGDRVRRA